MRQDADYFGDEALVLIYVARRLKHALALEQVFDAGGVDYSVVPKTYVGGLLFPSERVGAFFYVPDRTLEFARTLMLRKGFEPHSEAHEDGG